MDNLTIEEFLLQIGPEFTEYVSVFESNGFTTVGSLRCINIEEDIREMFTNANITLLLGKKRQLQNALENLKEVLPNSRSSVLQDTKPSLTKVVETSRDSLNILQRQLTVAEAEYATLVLAEREKDGRRCTICHLKGHKADNNKNNKACCNEPCKSINLCGQMDKHPEYVVEKKKKQKEISQLKMKVRKQKEEKDQLEQYVDDKKKDFMSSMRNRLRVTNLHKYQDGSKLMKDLHTLKIAYKGVVPENKGTDYMDFKDKLQEMSKQTSTVYHQSPGMKRKWDETQDSTSFQPHFHPLPSSSYTATMNPFFPMVPFFNSFPWQMSPFRPPSCTTADMKPIEFKDPTVVKTEHSAQGRPCSPIDLSTPKRRQNLDILADAAIGKIPFQTGGFDTESDADTESN